jgi:hypothetical protein
MRMKKVTGCKVGSFSLWAMQLSEESLFDWIQFCQALESLKNFQIAEHLGKRRVDFCITDHGDVSLTELNDLQRLWVLESNSVFAEAFHWLLRYFGGGCAPSSIGRHGYVDGMWALEKDLERQERMTDSNTPSRQHCVTSSSDISLVEFLFHGSKAPSRKVILHPKNRPMLCLLDGSLSRPVIEREPHDLLKKISPCTNSAPKIRFQDLNRYAPNS